MKHSTCSCQSKHLVEMKCDVFTGNFLFLSAPRVWFESDERAFCVTSSSNNNIHIQIIYYRMSLFLWMCLNCSHKCLTSAGLASSLQSSSFHLLCQMLWFCVFAETYYWFQTRIIFLKAFWGTVKCGINEITPPNYESKAYVWWKLCSFVCESCWRRSSQPASWWQRRIGF